MLFGAALACTLYEGVTHRRARRWIVLPAAILLFGAWRVGHIPPEALPYLVHGVPAEAVASLPIDPSTGQRTRRLHSTTFAYAENQDTFAAVLKEALRHDVAFVPGAAFFATNPDHATFRMSFTTNTPEEIAEGMARLAKVFR